MYKLSKTDSAKAIYFSLVLREREEKKTTNISHLSAENGQVKYWAESTCDCRCDVRENECSAGYRYDHIDQCE